MLIMTNNKIEPKNQRENLSELTIDSIVSPSDPFLRQALFDVHKWVCFYTRSSISFNEMEVEHIFPRAKWWVDTIANYFPACSSVNGLKWARYDSIATTQLISINRLTYAPSVLRRYIFLKRKLISDTKKILPSVRKPQALAFGWWDFLVEILNASSQEDCYIHNIWSRSKDVFNIILGKNSSNSENSFVDSHFSSIKMDELFRKSVYITDMGFIYYNASDIRLRWWANLVSSFWDFWGNQLKIWIALDYYFPEGSEGDKYMKNLRNNVNLVLNSL